MNIVIPGKFTSNKVSTTTIPKTNWAMLLYLNPKNVSQFPPKTIRWYILYPWYPFYSCIPNVFDIPDILDIHDVLINIPAILNIHNILHIFDTPESGTLNMSQQWIPIISYIYCTLMITVQISPQAQSKSPLKTGNRENWLIKLYISD